LSRLRKIEKDYRIWWLFLETLRAMVKARNKELAQYGITHNKAAVTLIINNLGYSPTPAEITRHLVIEPHTISDVLEVMEKQGLVEKSSDLERKNLVRVMLTEKGKQAHLDAMKRESVEWIMSCLSKQELQQLGLLLEKLWVKSLEYVGTKRLSPYPPSK